MSDVVDMDSNYLRMVVHSETAVENVPDNISF